MADASPRPVWVEATLAPARAAYLIRAGSVSGLRRAVQEASTRWGGMTEPIIPVRRGGRIDGWWEQVLGFARVEGLVNVDAGDDAAAAAERLALSLTPLAHIDRAGPTKWTCHPANLPGIDPLYPPVIATAQRKLWEVVAAGDITEEHEQHLRGEHTSIARATMRDQVARAVAHRATLLDQTLTGLSPVGGAMSHAALIWVSPPGGYLNCLWFWNARALGALRFDPAPMLLIPVNTVHHWVGFADLLAETLRRPDEFAPDVILLGSGVSADAMDKTAEALGLTRHDGPITAGSRWPTPLRQPPFTYATNVDYREWIAFDREYGCATETQVHFTDGIGSLRFDSPVAFRRAGYTLMRLRSAAFDGYPRRDRVAQQILPNAQWHGDQLQIATTATSRYRVELTLPRFADVLAQHLRDHTASYGLSDKGKIALGLLSGPTTTGLLVPGLPQAVSALTTPRSKTLKRELRKLRAAGSPDADLVELAHRWGTRGPRVHMSARDVGAAIGTDPIAALEALSGLGWAERGFQTKCSRCGISSFIPLAETASQPICPGCHAETSYTVVGKAVEVYYRLDTYVDRASDQGAVPQAVVAAALARDDPDAVVLPGVNIRLPNGASAEIDIVAICQRRILAGEVKTSPAEFDDEQLDKDLHKTQHLDADAHIVGTIYQLPTDRQEGARELAAAAGIELVIIDASTFGT